MLVLPGPVVVLEGLAALVDEDVEQPLEGREGLVGPLVAHGRTGLLRARLGWMGMDGDGWGWMGMGIDRESSKISHHRWGRVFRGKVVWGIPRRVALLWMGKGAVCRVAADSSAWGCWSRGLTRFLALRVVKPRP